MIPTIKSLIQGDRSVQLWLTGFIWTAVLLGLIAINYILPIPDIIDFRGLGAICGLMDMDIKYCVNNNWGFAHPLSCWLLTKLTGDLFISQRLLNALFISIYILLLIRMVRSAYGGLSWRSVGCILVFICSPWLVDAAVSTHLDIIPITLVFAAVSLIFQRRSFAAYAIAGLIAGSAYWFRFHFLPMALLLPILAGIVGKERKKEVRSAFAAALGVLVAISVPHILSLLAYGIFSTNNGRFVVGEALGTRDWSYESTVRVANTSIIDLLKSFNAKQFILKYGYHFITSGLFPLLIIVAIVVKDYYHENGKTIKAFFTGSDTHCRIILFVAMAAIAVLPFTLLRGFTFRLEAAFVLCAIPMVVGAVYDKSSKRAWIVFILIIFSIAVQQTRYWPALQAHKSNVIAIERIISDNVPRDVLANRPDKVICCVEYYNPYNKYKLCNMIVFGGWGTRSKPMIERYGLLHLLDPFENETYVKAEYIFLPYRRDVLNYTDELLLRNRTIYKDNNIVILQRK